MDSKFYNLEDTLFRLIKVYRDTKYLHKILKENKKNTVDKIKKVLALKTFSVDYGIKNKKKEEFQKHTFKL